MRGAISRNTPAARLAIGIRGWEASRCIGGQYQIRMLPVGRHRLAHALVPIDRQRGSPRQPDSPAGFPESWRAVWPLSVQACFTAAAAMALVRASNTASANAVLSLPS